MPIQVTCVCNRLLRVRDELAGKKVRCPECKQVVSVANAAEPPPLMAELVEAPVDTRIAPPKPSGPPPLPKFEEATFEITERPPLALSKRPPRSLDFSDDEIDDDNDRRPRKKRLKRSSRAGSNAGSSSSGGGFGSTSAGALGGLLMIVIAIVWFVAGLAGGILFYYPPILLVIGIIAVIKGLVDGGR